MSYESSNNFYSHNNNPNPRAQQMLSSNYYSRPPPQSSAMNQYQGYPSSTSHQTFPSYDPYESRSTSYYPPYASSHEQQRSVGANYYGENHVEPSVYLSKDSNSLNDSNSMMVSNDYQTGNTSTPMTQMPQRNISYHNSSMMPAAHPSLRQQQQGDPYGNSNASPYSYANSNVMNTRYSVPPHRSAYANDVTIGKVQPYPAQSSYPAYSNGPSNYPTTSQSTWPPVVSSNTTEPDSNYSHSQMQTSSSTTGTAEYRSQDDDSNSAKAKGSVPESPNYANISSNVFDDAESSNSSFSDSPSVSNEKASKKPKNAQITQSEILNKLREMGNEPERNLFIDRLQKLWEEHHVVCRKLPTLARQTIDLYRLYLLIREQNGFEQFSKTAKNRHWRDIALKLHIPNCSTAALTMKQKYIQLKLFHYECKYDRGSIDPEPILADIEKPKEKRSLKQTDEKSMNSFTETPSTKQPETDYQPASASAPNVNSQSQHAYIPPTAQFAKKADESYKVQLRAMPVAFPPNSVEATTLSTKFKRRKLTAKDIPPIDPMKLLMSLRAGLLAETTWALDTINIMLSDDQTHTYFRLKQMPGLLQAIIDNYLKCLTELFDELKVEHESQLQENQHESNQEQASVIYRIESNCLNKYQRKYSRAQDIKYEHVYDQQGNLKSNPESIVDLQNTDDLCYIQTHFDPLHVDDRYYENLHHSHHSDSTISSEEHDQEPTKTSVKRLKSLESDMSPNYNEEFLQHYKRKFQFDEDYSSSTNTDLNAHMNVNNQQENASAIFTRYSFGYDQTSSRCICISSILRNLSFIPGNDIELVKYQTLIHLLARLLLLRHNVKTTATSSDNDQSLIDCQSKNENSTILPSFSWSECLINIRENTLVTLTNIAGVLIFDSLDSDLINQLIDGLLHWSTCYSDEAMDPIQSPYLSAQRLSIEILTKLSIHEMNMDFILATPPVQRISSLFRILTDWLNVDEMNTQNSHVNRSQTYTQREFAIVLLNALLRCDSNVTSIITHIPYTISLLINFLEDYERKTNELNTRYGSDYVLRISNTQQAEQFLFTTNDMLKRAANCLLLIAHQSENTKLMKKYEDRILNLSISNIIDRNVGRILTDILHYCS
ncbi:unnamed protein product [Adineta ricciae]|uniref:ARID domain-containing protein n=1 Tax=Adineta ricciae TaxID=249248 RepID=A0A815YTZ7_ADIRI|nr:unnamed protein product [Adineta ricciae]CAF1574211.1 unnamed protein product [Adineta ricciae]